MRSKAQFPSVIIILAGLFLAAKDGPAQSSPIAKSSESSAAPVKIIEFFDYQCPYCLEALPALNEILKEYSGQAQLVLKHFPLSNHPDAMLAHQAALAAGEQGKFQEMHELLFHNQRNVQRSDLLEYAHQLKLDVPRFEKALKSSKNKAVIEQDIATANRMGIDGTPTFIIGGQKLVGAQPATVFGAAIEAALHSVKVQPETDTFSSREQLLAELDVSHSPALGDDGAIVTIVEFCDFQNPACATAVPGLKELVKQHPGKVQWVFKNCPVGSDLQNRAAMAASQQGKFWEMHDLMYASPKTPTRDDLMNQARGLDLDLPLFLADLDGPRAKDWIAADRSEADRLHIDKTPAYFINGKKYAALSPADLQKIVEEQISFAAAHSGAH